MADTCEWSFRPLGSFCEVRGGKRLPNGDSFATRKTTHRYIRVTDFRNYTVDLGDLKCLRPDTQAAISRYIITKDDVFISIAGTIGVVGMVPEELDGANLTENAARLVVIDRGAVLPRYLMFFLASKPAQHYLNSQTVKNAQPKLALVRIKSISVPIPPLDEQRQIAQVLSAVQQAIERQERLIALTAELKKALMQKLFTEGTRGEPLKTTEVGQMPESWAVERFDARFEAKLGKMLSQKSHSGQDTYPYLRNKNIQWGRIDLDDLLTMDFDEKERTRFELRIGDLLVCEGGEPGRAAIWEGAPFECYYQKALHRVRPLNGTATNEYLLCWLTYAIGIRNLYGTAGASSTIAHLPVAQLSALPVPFPSRAEQDAIAEVVAAVSGVEKLRSAVRSSLQTLFRTLLHQLMTAQVRVHDLDVSALDKLAAAPAGVA